MQQITKTSDKLTKKNIINRISDIPGGVSIVLSTLTAGVVIPEGTPLSAPSSGKRAVCKQAVLLSGSTTTVFRVESATNTFKTGDYIMQATGGAAYAGTVVKEVGTVGGVLYDTITVGTALEAATAGIFIYEATAEATALDATLNVAVDDGTSTGIVSDATSTDLKAAMPNQSTVATVVGTTTEPGNAVVTVSSDLLAADEVVTVAIADNDTAEQAASKMRNALMQNAVIVALFNVSGEGASIILTHKALTANGATLANVADTILKEAFQVPSTTQVIWIGDAYLRADVVESCIGALYLASLDVKVVKY